MDISETEHASKNNSEKTPEERQAALTAALKVDPGVAGFSSRAIKVSETTRKIGSMAHGHLVLLGRLMYTLLFWRHRL